jgi:fused signal recognition particle receptor
MSTTARLLDAVRTRAKDASISEPDDLVALIRDEVTALLDGDTADRTLHAPPGELNVWMFVGVNGVGKTTTIGKLASQRVADGHRVVLAAADTFRAAAADQLQLWAERTGGEIVRGQEGADPGSVVFDAMAAAGSRGADLVLVDTAGRLHTKTNLMEELKKLRRIVDRTPGACKEVLLVIDASTGQNGLVQAKQFAEAVDVTGIVLTKLDGTAKGGIVLAIQSELGIPVKVVGVGEGVGDLITFDPNEFAAALFEGDS